MALNPLVVADARVYYGPVDLTGFTNKVALDVSAEDLDATTFASGGWHARAGGLFDSSTSVDGFWQATDLTYPDDAYMATLGDATQPLTVVPTSGTVGSLAFLTRVLNMKYTLLGDDGKLAPFSAQMSGTAAVARGVILHPQGTVRTASGVGTGVNLNAGPLASQRLYATLHVLSTTGSPTLTVKVQSSVDNTFAAPTDRILFNAATTVGGQFSSVLGPITDTWVRVNWTFSGSGSVLFAVAAGIAAK